MTGDLGAASIVWFRRDLRLADNRALSAAAAGGGPVIPLFILDSATEPPGAAPRWRLGLALERLGADLAARGSSLVLRRGPALEALRALVAETGARAVHWTRLHDPASVARDTEVKAALRAAGIEARSHPGHLLFEPQTVATAAGTPFRVFTPFWKAVTGREVPAPLPAPARLPAPAAWPASDRLADWRLGAAMNRGAAVVRPHLAVGEAAAGERLAAFLAGGIARYGVDRDRPDLPGTSRLSENLAWGEISVATVWHAALRARAEGAAGAPHFLRELGWRDFAWHLAFHTPEILERNWRREWDAFPWDTDGESEAVRRWKYGMTGEPMVDAGMREMYVTGTMHNRLRMLVASYLTKHLLIHWKVGADWFAECLADWDPASNAMGWQWTAGSGPDAAPYFRIYNPRLQAERYDPEGRYRRRFLHRPGAESAAPEAQAFLEALPRSLGITAQTPCPAPLVDLEAGRARALAAYAALGASGRAVPA